MSLIVLSFKVVDGVKTSLSKSNQAKAARTTLRFAAEYWHKIIMPERFEPKTQGGYRFEARTEIYLRVIKRIMGLGVGKGAGVMLRLRSQSFRAAQFNVKITATASVATVTMAMPTYFTDRKTGVVYDGGKRKMIRHQPDMAQEMSQTTAANVKKIDERATEIYLAHFTSGASPAGGSWGALGARIDSKQTVTIVIQ